MNTIFEFDSPFMHFINRFASLVVLNFLFLLTSIPIFTIGASLSALYDVVFRLDTPREGKVFGAYLLAFRNNFRQSTPAWLLMLVTIAVSCVNMVYFSNMSGTFGYLLFLISATVLVNCVLVLGFLFPLISQFDNTFFNTLKNSLLLCVANLPRALLIAVINCFPWLLMLLNLYTFIQIGFIWFSLYFSAAAYFNSRVLMKVFDPLKEQASN